MGSIIIKRTFTVLCLVYLVILSSGCLFKRDGIETTQTSPWPTFQHDMKHTGRSPFEGPENPVLIWKFETGGGIFSPPTVGADGTIYVGSDDHYLYALNPDGSCKWSFEAEHWVRTSPVLSSDGTIYVGSRDDYLYAVNPDGTMKWKFKTGS